MVALDMRIKLPITGAYGKGRSLNENSGYTLNCYVEQASDGKTVLVGTPGLMKKFTLPNAPVRGCFSDTSVSYWLAGNTVYKVDVDFTVTALGNIMTYNGHVQFASSGIDIMLVDGTHGWSIKISTGVLTQITDPDFPANATNVVYTKGYFVVTVKNSQTFYISEKLNIATVWNGLDFATAEGNPDVTIGMAIYQDQILFFGYKSVEFWDFTGNVDFPMQRSLGAVVDHGCISGRSVAKCADSVYWLGADNLGQGIVWRINGYMPERVSTHEIEQQIALLPLINDAYAITYQQDGHIFYILQFPSSDLTLAYDASTGLWHRRSYRDITTGADLYWRVSSSCFSGALTLVGDIQSGNIYSLDLGTYTDNGAPIVRESVTTAMSELQMLMYYQTIIVEVEAGVGLADGSDPKLALQWSNDYGHTWSNWRYASIGKIGQYRARAKFNMLGMGRNRVWRFRMTDPVKFYLLGAVLDVRQGQS
jgi:hypothetical protein